jgi:dephospho-CoA kinase
MNIVAICGRMGSGKDALADILVHRHGFVAKLKFADPLKATLRTLFSLREDQIEGDAKDSLDPRFETTPRRLMQWFGTEVMQHSLQRECPRIGRRIWAELLMERIRALETQHDDGGAVVISDMRFQHELDALREAFGTSRVFAIRIERPPHRNDRSDLFNLSETHESETTASNMTVDAVIVNDGTLDDLDRRYASCDREKIGLPQQQPSAATPYLGQTELK